MRTASKAALATGAARAAAAAWLLASSGAAFADASPPMAGADNAVAWPAVARPDAEAPSVLLIMTDDVGFGASSTFGGPVETPTFDSLAKTGLRYSNMTTIGICSPTRAALLTGRNHNAINVGNVTDGATGYDGYTSDIPKSAATGARLLRDAGYATAMFGKNHMTPQWELGPSGPFDRWPTGLGFQYFYGFLNGDTNQWAPALYRNTVPVEVPSNDPDYFFERDMADDAIAWLRRQQGANPGKPFFVYYAPGTAHAPHHVPADWIAKYKGRFDRGWDAVREETLARQKRLGVVPANTRLAAKPEAIPDWSALSDRQKRVYARQMEVFAAALSFADHQIGRVIEEARRQAGGNLMVVYVQGDNGASAEAGLDGTTNEHATVAGIKDSFEHIEAHIDDFGGPKALNHYSTGWATAMVTPFPWFKQLPSHYGATRNGVVIDWGGHIGRPGGVRSQFHHIIDVMPTILDAAKVAVPEQVDGVKQQPLDGVSMRYSFNAADAPSQRTTQYYAIWDNVALYKDGWVASTVPEVMPYTFGPDMAKPGHMVGRQWQLYNVAKDFSQSTDLATKYPDKLAEMKTAFEVEAGRNKALPIHRFEGSAGRPSYNAGVRRFTFTGPVSRIPEEVAPGMTSSAFELTADLDLAEGKTDGALMALGGRFGGLSLSIENARPVFTYNFGGLERTVLKADTPLTPGKHRIGLRMERTGPGFFPPARATLSVDGTGAGSTDIARTVRYRISLDEAFDIGRDTGTTVSESRSAPDAFAGTINSVVIDLK